jgi:hypothetical protein
MSGNASAEPVHLVADIVPNMADVKAHLRAQALFSELRTCGQPAFTESVPQRRADRLRMVLLALDGFLAVGRGRSRSAMRRVHFASRLTRSPVWTRKR